MIKILLHFAKKPADEDASVDIAKRIVYGTCFTEIIQSLWTHFKFSK